MILQCRNCAGNVTADEEAIRRGVVTCDYCHTALRVTEKRVDVYKKRILDSEPPDDIKIKRDESEIKISVPVRTLRSRVEMVYLPVILIGVLAVGTTTWFVLRHRNDGGGWGVVAGIAALLGLMILFSDKHPYLRLHQGLLEHSHGKIPFGQKIPINEIKQLYVTTNRLQSTRVSPLQHSLYVLKKDDSRVRMFGDFKTVQGALFVEEYLEIELDIFDLPVYGEVEISTIDLVASQDKSDEHIPCYSCASNLLVTNNVRQRGHITCEYCQAITLFYTQASHELILGQPNPEQMMFEVVRQEDKVGVFWKKRKGEVVLLLKKYLVIQAPLNPSVEGKKLERIGIKELVFPRPLGLEEMFSKKLYEQLDQNLAYSAETAYSKPINYSEQLFGHIQYSIIGRIEGKNHVLIRGLNDLREAAFIFTLLNEYLKSFSS